ncbi:MAG: hypothetical protein E6600_01080 [Anaerocolumna aminovalerica]|jgi:hypothetical protein|uniref:hypothetical protein n=1 Tax=Anaerocolumna aminovalerica TaxID=1527 RepID=UPI000BE251A2|nr:hypothetical protein [Anaerocolumna aminovalerica]MDU6263074.1 hypothetical protein [Anaerocolumna aminovalerica]
MKFKKFTKLFSLCLLLTLFTNSTAFASTENFNVSTTKPTEYTNDGDITVFGTGKPSTKWDVSVDGTYYFSGSAEVSTLYTNVKFTVNTANGLWINVNNKSGTTLTVKLIKDNLLFDTVIDTLTIAPYDSISTVYAESVIPGNYYYLSFSAPSNFDGSVS